MTDLLLTHNLEQYVTDPQVLDNLVSLYKAMGDETRLKIVLALLVHKELTTSEIAIKIGVSFSAVSHQLSLLKLKKLVTNRRLDKRSLYRLVDNHVEQLLKIALEHALE